MAAHCSDDLSPRIVGVARTWIGTPYCHQASCKGVGSDCLGLIRGVWREILGSEPASIEAYSPDWAEVTRSEVLLEGLGAHLVPTAANTVRPGDVLVFRMLKHGPAKHLAILADSSFCDASATMIHVYSGHATREVHLSVPWRRRLAGAFRYPMTT